MAAKVTVTLRYIDNSRTLTESWTVADSHPSAEVIKSCEDELRQKWIAMGGAERDLYVAVKVS